MPEPTIFDLFFQYKIAGLIPLWTIIFPAIILFIIWLIVTRKPRQKEYKALDLKKAIKDDLNLQYKYFSEGLGKPVYCGMIKLGYALGFMNIFWNKRIASYKRNIDYKKLEESAKEIYQKSFNKLSKEQKDEIKKFCEPYEISIEKDNPTFKRQKIIEETTPMFAFKIRGLGLLNSIKARFGFGIKYFIIDEKMVVVNDNSININDGLQKIPYFDNFIFSVSGKQFLEDISFRINRQNELQEIANIVPRVVFWDTEVAKRIANLRERAEIETKRFKGQKEEAED